MAQRSSVGIAVSKEPLRPEGTPETRSSFRRPGRNRTDRRELDAARARALENSETRLS